MKRNFYTMHGIEPTTVILEDCEGNTYKGGEIQDFIDANSNENYPVLVELKAPPIHEHVVAEQERTPSAFDTQLMEPEGVHAKQLTPDAPGVGKDPQPVIVDKREK